MKPAALRKTVLALLVLSVAANLCAQAFKDSYRIPLPTDPGALTSGDLNGDGVPDFIWMTGSPQGGVNIQELLSGPAGGWLPGANIPFPQTVTRFTGCVLVDVNHDQRLDLTCGDANQFTIYVHVFMGNGDGTFQSPIETIVTSNSNGGWAIPLLYPVGDLDGDGYTDFYEEEANSQEVHILLSDGRGGFKPQLPAPQNVSGAPVPADVNGDGIPDLLFPFGPMVALGHGDGTFATEQNYARPAYFTATCVFHDMDGDGHLDAVCGYPETITGDITGATDLIILHGNRDGSFNTTPIAQKRFGDYNNEFDGFGTFLRPVAVADLNGDGIPDVLGDSGDGLAVLLGGPGLTFSTPLHYARAAEGIGAFWGYYNSVIRDMNGDGSPDVVDAGPNGIYISYGHNDGTFSSAFAPEVTEYIGYPTVADFNGDGIPDIAATGDTAIKLSLGKGDGTFAAPVALSNNNGAINFSTPLSATNAHIVHGDFNGDGKLDLLAIGSSSIYQYDSYLLLGNGNGTFKDPVLVPNSSSIYPMYEPLVDSAVADINRDGKSDLLGYETFPSGQGSISWLLSNGDGTFKAVSTTVPVDQFNSYAIMTLPALEDFDADGKLDAVYAGFSNVYVVKGHGDGYFDTTATVLAIPPLTGVTSLGASSVSSGDLDGDGNRDAVVLTNYAAYPDPIQSAAWAFFGDGKGGFSAATLIATFNRTYQTIAAADLNRDGRADIVVKTSGSLGGGYAVGVIGSLPGRTFGPEVNYTAGTGDSSLAIADLNGDGWQDIVIGNGDYNVRASSVTLLMNVGNNDQVNGTVLAVPEPSVVAQAFTLKASLLPPTPAALSGSVEFSIDGNAIGSAALTGDVATLPVAGTSPIGQHTVAATWAGDTNYNATVLHGRHSVVAAPTTTTIASSLNPAPSGSNVTFTTTVASSYGTPAGTVTFTDGATALGAVPLNGSGVASYATSALAVGTHEITASYAANGTFAASSASLSEVIRGLPSAISFFGTPNPAYVAHAVTLNARLTGAAGLPSGTVSFADGAATLGSASVNASGVATLTANFSRAGVHTLAAVYGGDSIYDPSTPAAFEETVLLNPTELTVTGSPDPAVVFQTILFTAVQTSSTGYAATGTVTFFANGNAMGTGTLQQARALFSTAALAPGTYAITASYPGSDASTPSTAPPFTLVVGPESSQTSLTSGANPAAAGTSVTLTAHVTVAAGAPTGTVQFYDGTTLLGAPGALSAQRTATYTSSTLALGTHVITAVYSGDGNVLPSTSAALNQDIVPYVGDFSINAAPPAISIYQGQSARFTVTVTSSNGFNQPVTLACTGLPAENTCGFSPATVADGQGTATFSVQTSAPHLRSSDQKTGMLGTGSSRTIALAAMALLYLGRRRRWCAWLSLLVVCLSLGSSACAGPLAITGGTPAGNYVFSVTGSVSSPAAPTLSHSTSVTVNVKSLF